MTTTQPDPQEPVIPVRNPRSRRAVLTVGPRRLPTDGWVNVWIDTGSGPGYVRQVCSDRLTLADADDGAGESAIYHLHPAPADITSQT